MDCYIYIYMLSSCSTKMFTYKGEIIVYVCLFVIMGFLLVPLVVAWYYHNNAHFFKLAITGGTYNSGVSVASYMCILVITG